MLIGDDLPSFMARADHAAGVEGELQVGELRVACEPGAELLDILLGRVVAVLGELDLDHRVHRPGVGRVGGRQVGDHAELGDDQLRGRRRALRGRTSRPARSSPRSPRSGCRWGRGRRSRRRRHRPRGRTRGGARDRATTRVAASRPTATPTVSDAVAHDPVEQPRRTSAMPRVDQPLPPGEGAGRSARAGCARGRHAPWPCRRAGWSHDAACATGRTSATGGRRQIIANATASAIGRIQELAQPGHQGQRRQHQEGAERRDQLGQRHLAGAQEGRLLGRRAQAEVPVRVLQADDRAIDQRADRQREPGQRHHVDRVARWRTGRPTAARTEIGIVITAIAVIRHWPRKSRITSEQSTAPSTPSSIRLSIDWRT